MEMYFGPYYKRFLEIYLSQDDPRKKLQEEENGNILIISNAEAEDAGDYTCKVSASKPVEVEHKVRIRGKNSIITQINVRLHFVFRL